MPKIFNQKLTQRMILPTTLISTQRKSRSQRKTTDLRTTTGLGLYQSQDSIILKIRRSKNNQILYLLTQTKMRSHFQLPKQTQFKWSRTTSSPLTKTNLNCLTKSQTKTTSKHKRSSCSKVTYKTAALNNLHSNQATKPTSFRLRRGCKPGTYHSLKISNKTRRTSKTQYRIAVTLTKIQKDHS